MIKRGQDRSKGRACEDFRSNERGRALPSERAGGHNFFKSSVVVVARPDRAAVPADPARIVCA